MPSASLNTLRQQEQQADQAFNASLREDDRATAAISTATTRAEEMSAIRATCAAGLAEIDAEIAGLTDSTALNAQVTA